MDTVKRWVRALFGREPMGVTEAAVLVAGGAVGAVTIRDILLQPSEAPLWVGIWWLGLAASLFLLLRGGYALLGLAWLFMGRPAALWIGDRIPFEFRPPITRKATAVNHPPLGVLDFEQATSRATDRLVKILEGLGKDMIKATGMFTSYGPRFTAATNASTRRKIALAREFAVHLDAYARKFERHQRGFRVERTKMIESSLPRLRAFEPDPSLVVLRDSISSMRDAVIESRQAIRDNRASVIKMRGTNLHQSLNLAVDRLLAATTEMVVDYDATADYATEALAIIEAKIPKPKSPPKKGTKAP